MILTLISLLKKKKEKNEAQPLFDCHIKTKRAQNISNSLTFFHTNSPAVRTRWITKILPIAQPSSPLPRLTLNCLIVTLSEKTKDSLRDTPSFLFYLLFHADHLFFFLLVNLWLNIPSHAWALNIFFFLLFILSRSFQLYFCQRQSFKQFPLHMLNYFLTRFFFFYFIIIPIQDIWYSVVDWSVDNYFRKLLFCLDNDRPLT